MVKFVSKTINRITPPSHLSAKKNGITIRNKNRRQVLFLFGNNRGFSYDVLGTIVKVLYDTALY